MAAGTAAHNIHIPASKKYIKSICPSILLYGDVYVCNACVPCFKMLSPELKNQVLDLFSASLLFLVVANSIAQLYLFILFLHASFDGRTCMRVCGVIVFVCCVCLLFNKHK
jgi:hypothetical protein